MKIAQGKSAPPTGAHVIAPDGPRRSAGFVTSSYADTSVGRPVMLALVEADLAQEGKEIAVWHDGTQVLATVCNPCVHDPEGERLHA